MDGLFCELNKQSSVPLYEQLYSYIKKEIIEGRIEFGTKLPSKRKLSEFLKVSQNTVETAYEQLLAEGYIEVIARKGFFVQTYEDLQFVSPTIQQRNTDKLEMKEVIDYHFHPSQIDSTFFPFDKWRKHMKNALTKSQHHLLLLGDYRGEYELRYEISQYIYHSRGVICKPEQIIIGAGVEVLLQQLVLLLGSSQMYGVEDPGYHVILKILKHYPNKATALEMDDKGISIKHLLQSKLDVLYLTPSHHFPYGTVLSINRRKRILEWAEEKSHRYIIEDDYDSEFRYSGKTIPSLHSMDRSEKVIYLGSFSKSLMPSARISYMVLPNTLLHSYQEQFNYFHQTVSRIDQVVLAEFMKNGDFEKHLNRMKKIYRRKLERVKSILKPYEQDLTIVGEQSGLHIVLVVHNGLTEKELIDKAKEKNLKIYPLSSYSMKNSSTTPPKFVIGFASIQEEKLEVAFHSLLTAWGFLE
ncbi:transcriptional regulator [Bacillus sp. TS-2]|nr:transcriptional regulator [Bacillus sp. TS-2]